MNVAIIDYGSGNLRSAAKAFERAVREAGGNGRILVTAHAAEVARADRIVLPGVGAFADCRRGLSAVPGMAEALREAVIGRGRPFLGICVGMQLMSERGFEHGVTEGLGWIPGRVVALAPAADQTLNDTGFRIPHMGWNELEFTPGHPVFAGLAARGHAYFVHSFQLECANPAHCLATVSYGQTVTAAVGRDNMVGTQFHPEKSQELGLRLIANFLSWSP
ncbi:MAG: imidazole glycerol phosphate synthase subunit HisH [Rhodospirillaceae bacterium]|nr:imidazole glycerol phosphate synthase subunit HisH [Rhodospirillaceae bacterium]